MVAAVAAAACVSKGKYKTLQKQLEETKTTMGAEIGQRDAKIQSVEQALKQEQEKLATLEETLENKRKELQSAQVASEKKEKEIARLGREQKGLQGELAALLKDRSRLRESKERMQEALAELSARKAQAEARVDQFRGLLARFKTLIDAGKLRVTIVEGRMVLALPTDVLFASGKAKLSKEGTVAIIEISEILQTLADRRFQIEGHTDNVPIKTSRYQNNWALASARALVVVEAMLEAGMNGSLVSAASFGEFRPVTSNETKEGRAANRRIEIVLVPDLSTLPGFDELKKAVDTK